MNTTSVKQFGPRSGPTFVVSDLGQTVCKGYKQTTQVGKELNYPSDNVFQLFEVTE